MQPT